MEEHRIIQYEKLMDFALLILPCVGSIKISIPMFGIQAYFYRGEISHTNPS